MMLKFCQLLRTGSGTGRCGLEKTERKGFLEGSRNCVSQMAVKLPIWLRIAVVAVLAILAAAASMFAYR